MAGVSFVGDPYTGDGTIRLEDGSIIPGNLAQAFDGRFYMSNGHLIDTTDLMNPLSIGVQGPFTMTEYTGGRFNLISQTAIGQTNRPINESIMRMVGGAVNVVLSTGELQTYTVTPTPVTHLGQQYVAYPRADGTTGYASTRGPFTTNAEVEAALGAGFRLATGEEAAYAAVFKRVLEDNDALLARYIEANGLEDDTIHTAEYKAAQLIMEMGGFGALQSYSSVIIE